MEAYPASSVDSRPVLFGSVWRGPRLWHWACAGGGFPCAGDWAIDNVRGARTAHTCGTERHGAPAGPRGKNESEHCARPSHLASAGGGRVLQLAQWVSDAECGHALQLHGATRAGAGVRATLYGNAAEAASPQPASSP